MTRKAASNFIIMWCKGTWKNQTEQCGEYGGDIAVYPVYEVVPGRSRDDMEIVEFVCTEVAKPEKGP